MRVVTVRQCAVLVGGLGTRLGTLTANAPKPLLPCGDRLFVAWLMRELLRFGVEEFILLTGYRATDVESSVQSLSALLPHETLSLCRRNRCEPAPAARSTTRVVGWINGSCCATAIRCSTAISPDCCPPRPSR